jgi:hypothetical protein
VGREPASPDSLGWKTWETETFAIRYPPNAELEGADVDLADLPANVIRGPLSHGPDGRADYYVQIYVEKNRAQRLLRAWVDSVLLANREDRDSSIRNLEKADTVRVGDLIFIRLRSATRLGLHDVDLFWFAGPKVVVSFSCTVDDKTPADEERFIAICESIVKSFHWR